MSAESAESPESAESAESFDRTGGIAGGLHGDDFGSGQRSGQAAANSGEEINDLDAAEPPRLTSGGEQVIDSFMSMDSANPNHVVTLLFRGASAGRGRIDPK